VIAIASPRFFVRLISAIANNESITAMMGDA
jgi:hypothetical protein